MVVLSSEHQGGLTCSGSDGQDIRRQFKIPAILEGTKEPDYDRAVDISTSATQKEVIALSAITTSIPLILGILFGVEALGGFLGRIIVSGQLLAVHMSHGGGAWDNAEKYIEDRPVLLRNTLAKAGSVTSVVLLATLSVTFKDTAGPALGPCSRS